MSKNVAVFVDVANIFYAAKAAGVDIDYVTLLKAASAGRDLVRAYAYTGLDPENENQRQFHAFLNRNGYKVVSKDIRKYGDGKVKANLDIELVVDLMRTSGNLDIAVVVSGDGDFAPAIRAVQQTGVRVEVISFRGNTSSDLIDVADVFTDITQIARVERSSRSGRRVAAEEEDLSMTEVPDKETEGASRRRRGRRGEWREGREGYGREERRRERPAAAAAVAAPVAAAASGAAGGALVVLPGEKLSKAAVVVPPALDEDVEAAEEVEGVATVAEAAEEAAGQGQEGGRRRRRRRGGRGRGRGRGQEGAAEAGVPGEEVESEAEETLEAEAPRVPQHSTFGSVWDSQLGMPSAPVAASGELSDEELEEPEIPEYLLTERRQRGSRGARPMGGRGGRGPRGTYQQAIERERFGRGGMQTGRPMRGGERGPRPQFERPERNRPARQPQIEERPEAVTSGGGAEPWSEVPPEVAELLRAEMARRTGRPQGEAGARREPTQSTGGPAAIGETAAAQPVPEAVTPAPGHDNGAAAPAGELAARAVTAGRGRGRGGRTRRVEAEPAGEAGTPGAVLASEAEPGTVEQASARADSAPARRTRRRTAPAEAGAPGAEGGAAEAAPARRGRRTAAGETAAAASGETGAAGAEPVRRRGRRAAGEAGTAAGVETEGAPAATAAAAGEKTAAPRRRARRAAAATETEPGAQPEPGVEPAPRRRTRRTSAEEA